MEDRIMKINFAVFAVLTIACEVYGGFTYPKSAEYIAGEGANEAIIVIDFDADNYFVFKYKWEGLASGWDALAAIEAAGALEVNAKWYEEFGSHFVSDFVYPGGQKHDYGGGAMTGWGYWGSVDGQNWTLNAGVDMRQLSNGSWDGWVWSNYDFSVSWDPLRGPGQEPIPEPGTVCLLGIGIIFLFGKRKGNCYEK